MSEWRTIDSAPRCGDGVNDDWVEILVYEDCGIMYVAAWDKTHGVWMNPSLPPDDELQTENSPTHWQPLPEPPQ